jgi:hypothetical protein
MAQQDTTSRRGTAPVPSQEYEQLLTARALAVLGQLEAAQPSEQLLLFPRRQLSAASNDVTIDAGDPAAIPMVELAARAGIAVLVGKMAEEVGRERVAAMSEVDFRRTLAQWMAQRLDIPDRHGFLAALERALGLPPLEPGVRPELPLAYASGQADIPTSIALRAVSHLAWAEPDQLRRDDQGHLSFQHSDSQGEVVLTFRDQRPGPAQTPDGSSRSDWLEREFRHFGDADLDTLLVLLARLGQSADEAGGIWLAAADVLNERGLQKKRKRENGKFYDCGHRVEDLAEVAACMERLGMIWMDIARAEVPVGPARGRRRTKSLVLQDHLVQLGQRVSQPAPGWAGGQVAIAWYVKPGQALAAPIAHEVAPVARHVLSYHSHHQRWAKRLGIYFTIHMRLGAGSVVRRTVGDLLRAVSLNFELRNPHRSWSKLNDALLRLRTDGVITSYEFVRLPDPLPARGWPEIVLNTTLEVHGHHPALSRPAGHALPARG